MKLIKIFILGFSFVFFSSFAFVIKDIRAIGLQRISIGSFFNYLPVKAGDTITERDYPNIIKTLYKTDFFSDISLSKDQDVLVVYVTERPVIGEIRIDGNKDLSKDDLTKGLSEMGLSEGDSYDSMRLTEIKKQLLNLYYARSKYDVIIDAKAVDLDEGRVSLQINIQEGISARIKQINIVGNKAYSEKTILQKLQLSTGSILSVITKSDQYSGEKLKGDLETIQAFYLDRGFADFKILSSQVSLTDDKKWVYITINIKEGLPYKISDIQFSGSDIVPFKELNDSLNFHTNEYYSRKKIRSSRDHIKDLFGNQGYAFADIQIIPNINRETHEIAIHFIMSPGKKAYIRRIQFTGNYKTNDEVLRREMRQMESELYNQKKLDRSLERLQRLGNITSVKKKEIPVDGKEDQVDVVYEVIETPSRSITAGIGYGDTAGLILNAGYQTANFLGTGNQFNIDFSTSDIDKNYTFSFTDPYWTADGISRTYSFYYKEEDLDEESVGDWSTDNLGAFLRFGFPINEYESFRAGGGYRFTKINTGDDVAEEIPAYLEEENRSKFNEYLVDFSWTHDTRDKTVFANTGSITRINSELVLPGSDETYYKLGVRNRTYFNLSEDFLMSARGDISYGDGYGDTDELPFYRNYYAGGLRTIRGYESNSLGPKYSNGDVAGGNFRVTGGLELILPWKIGTDDDNVRIGAFLDFGNVYDGVGDFDIGDFRYSTGLYLLWRSPVGPLNLSYGIPLNEEGDDDIENFQFTVGVPL